MRKNLDLLKTKVRYASVYEGDKWLGYVKDIIPEVGWRGYMNYIENQYGEEGKDFVICPVCKNRFTSIAKHYSKFHKAEFGPLKEAFPGTQIMAVNSSVTKENWCKIHYPNLPIDEAEKKYQQWRLEHNMNQGWGTGESNHNHRKNSTEHDRKSRSPRCLEYYERMYPGKTKEEYEEMRNTFYQDISDKRDNSLCFEYYMEHYNVTEDEAREMLAERQRTNKPDVYIRNYGQELGLKLYRDKLLRWHSKMHKYQRESDFVSAIIEHFNLDLNKCMFEGRYDTSKMGLLETIPDFIYEDKVIEFYGDYWHQNLDVVKPSKILAHVHERDAKVNERIIKAGYKLLVVWENDWLTKRNKVLNEIKEFLQL